ncbi:hypothetical protein [Actinoallomurus purpureus]|nr:hypothetical protein [Actinoallomurus purpureus]
MIIAGTDMITAERVAIERGGRPANPRSRRVVDRPWRHSPNKEKD